MSMEQRYQRQLAFRHIGPEGQRRLASARATIIGVGALGTAIANSLARAGFGYLRLVDADRVEASNLQRQTLFDEADAAAGRLKVEAAAAHLRGINSSIVVDARATRADAANIAELVSGVDIVLDGGDNFQVRYLANDACRAAGVPWIYGGVLGDSGVTLNVLPDSGPCLRCLMPEPPEPGSFDGPEQLGVLNQIVAVIGAIEAVEAMKIVLDSQNIRRSLLSVSLWDTSFYETAIDSSPDCPVCGMRHHR